MVYFFNMSAERFGKILINTLIWLLTAVSLCSAAEKVYVLTAPYPTVTDSIST